LYSTVVNNSSFYDETALQYNTIQYNTIGLQYKKMYNVPSRTMSVSWQSRRRGQSLVAHERVKKQQQNCCFLTLCFSLRLNEVVGGEMQIFRAWRSRFVGQHNWKRDDL